MKFRRFSMTMINRAAALLLAAAGCAAAATAAAPTAAPPASTAAHDDAMAALATHSGCLTCHAIKSGGASSDGTKPIGPAWQDVAVKYKGQKDAANALTSTVMGGSNPYVSHWAGKVTGLAMPPNAVAIRRKDARRLVRWILTLDDPR
jgi:cytochrome c